MSHTTPADTTFKAAYATLNEEQKMAVDTIEGPVMVVAGPGTGKTQTIALRVANILQKTHMRPSNILCLTFSTSGVKAMRERLKRFIGSDAYAVTVQTVHGFCNDVIQTYPDTFADFRALDQVSALERLRIIRKAISELPPHALLRQSGMDRAMDIAKTIDEMKQENVRTATLRSIVPTYMQEIQYTKTGKERNKETESFKNDVKKVQKLEEFIQVYDAYNATLEELHKYDFTDMILKTIDALTMHDWLLAPLQERYQYILVDEFQDLNRAQMKVIQLLVTAVYGTGAANIFCVGDDDQAIFRFQGASISNMKEFIQMYPQTTIINLVKNYRSVQPVLNTAMAVIQNNTERLANQFASVKKDLLAMTNVPGEKPQFLRYPNSQIQMSAMVETLQTYKNNGKTLSDIAIICRRNAECFEVAEYMQAGGIPYTIVADLHLLQDARVLECIAILRAVLQPTSNEILSSALAVPTVGIPTIELAMLWTQYRESVYERSRLQMAPMCLLDFICTIDATKFPHVHTFALQIFTWHNTMSQRTVPELFVDILKVAHFLKDMQSVSINPLEIASIHALYDYVKMRCYEQKNITLMQIMHDIDELQAEPELKLTYDVPHISIGGVQIMTAHASKGLEFDTVIIPNAWYGNFGNRKGSRSYSIPRHILFGTSADENSLLNQEDERRLFFVSITRAKSELFILFPEVYRSGDALKNAEVSVFLAEAGATVRESSATTSSTPLQVLQKPALDLDAATKAYLLSRIENFELSVTALNSFLNDPMQFLWEQLLMRPSAKNANLCFGSAVHAALEKFAHAKMNTAQVAKEELCQWSVTHLEQREVLTNAELEVYTHRAKTVLGAYYDAIQSEDWRTLSTEKSLKASVDGIPLKGKIDRIDMIPGSHNAVSIIDYKTGHVYKTIEAVKKNDAYFRQLVFYKILCTYAPAFPYTAESFSFDFIGGIDEKRRRIDVQVSDADMQDLIALIKIVWDKILRLDFTPIADIGATSENDGVDLE